MVYVMGLNLQEACQGLNTPLESYSDRKDEFAGAETAGKLVFAISIIKAPTQWERKREWGKKAISNQIFYMHKRLLTRV